MCLVNYYICFLKFLPRHGLCVSYLEYTRLRKHFNIQSAIIKYYAHRQLSA